MNKDKRKHYRFRLTDESIDYIDDYAVLHNVPYSSRTESLERIIKEHKKYSEEKFSLEYIVESVSKEVSKSVQIALQKSIVNEVNRVRLGTNNADRNTQIIIELLQGFMQNENIEHIITTDDNKPSFLNEVEELIKKRITKQKQRKDNK